LPIFDLLRLFNSANVCFSPASCPVSYSGLVSFWIGREIKDGKKAKKWLARGAECKDEMEKLAASASEWNFQNSEYQFHDHDVIFLFLSCSTMHLTLLSYLFHIHRSISSPS